MLIKESPYLYISVVRSLELYYADIGNFFPAIKNFKKIHQIVKYYDFGVIMNLQNKNTNNAELVKKYCNYKGFVVL